MDGVFVTSCSAEITEIVELDGYPLKRSPVPERLKQIYRDE
jgi:hypothetical protein